MVWYETPSKSLSVAKHPPIAIRSDASALKRQIVTRDRTKEAYQALVHEELPGLYSLARRLERDGAEDLVQEALLQGYRAFESLKEEDAGARWLKTILVNVFRDELRKRGRRIVEVASGDLEDFSLYRTLIDEDPLPYSDTLHADFLWAFGPDDLREVLIRMPEIYRAPMAYPLRWPGGESGLTVPFLSNAADPGGIAAGAAGWTNEPLAFINLSYNGVSTSIGTAPNGSDGKNGIYLNYTGSIPPGIPCADGVGCAIESGSTTHVFAGQTFFSIADADILVFPSGMGSAFNSVVIHEMGHAIGFRHSNQGTPSSSVAVMNSSVSFTSLQQWDKDKQRRIDLLEDLHHRVTY